MSNRPATGLADIRSGLYRPALWISLAVDELRKTYRNSAFGIAWIALSYAAFVFVLTVVFGDSIRMPKGGSYQSYISVGYFFWLFILGTVVESSGVFLQNAAYVKTVPLPLSVLVFKVICKNIISSIVRFPILLLFLVISGSNFHPIAAIQSSIAVLILVLTAFGVGLVLSSVCLLFRDIQFLVQSVMGLMLFLTPVIWVGKNAVGMRATFSTYNPFAYFLDLVRNPIVGWQWELQQVLLCSSISVSTVVIGVTLFSFARRRAPFLA